MEHDASCPLRKEKSTKINRSDYFGYRYICPNCGTYDILRNAQINLNNLSPLSVVCLSHYAWKSQRSAGTLLITEETVENVEKESLPTPNEQLNNFIYYLGREFENNPGNIERIPAQHLRAKLGAFSEDDVYYIVKQAQRFALVEESGVTPQATGGRLTIEGWQRYEELKRGKASGKTAFLAMSFKEEHREDQDFIIETFKPVVAETGFRLQDIRENPEAGLIDNHIRVAIRMARFVIADLTHSNQGAYWEAGYAEGLGKPVIYSCREDVFNDPTKRPHFDTNYCQTVVWDHDKPKEAIDQLASTIRATLPFEATMPKEEAL